MPPSSSKYGCSRRVAVRAEAAAAVVLKLGGRVPPFSARDARASVKARVARDR